MKIFFTFSVLLIALFHTTLRAQLREELDGGWHCKKASEVAAAGEELSGTDFSLEGWKPAVVPGTVLTTLLANDEIPDPFYGMNNEEIPDIYHAGKEYYTYWFATDFSETLEKDEQAWLHFRGVNYSCEIYLNGKKVNPEKHKGMFLRQTYHITDLLNAGGKNRLAVLVYPPDHMGNPNGGQGGDGTIGRNVAHQYVAGWDWIQPVRDRNTGIWDKVWIEKTKPVNLKNPHVVTRVAGKRKTTGEQRPASIEVSAELENPTGKSVSGVLQYHFADKVMKRDVTVGSHSVLRVNFDALTLADPQLWWPHGYGEQFLYDLRIQFLVNGKILSDEERLKVGVREIQKEWNPFTRSMEILVNGQKIFIKGGNWIISDAMLRFSPERYDAEVRFHRDMNLNLIRIWGGAIAERPAFYEACDKYGLLVIQDFWMSGDCNGRWLDPMKKDDQWTRRKYPDDHDLFLKSAADVVKMIRNHPSLAMWCGGNEIEPPEDIFVSLRDNILPELDGTRWFIPYSNSDSMSYNFIGGNGDGPYTIQPIERFWQERTFPFNSEVGSIGVGDHESLRRFIPEKNMVPPKSTGEVDPVWAYHKYIGYDEHIDPYGKPESAAEFAEKAQLVNYNQYRALSEGFAAHMWEWYTGYIIWKTQNPWTALRGQMYDYYLDPNAGLYGLRKGAEPLHVMCNPVDGMVMLVNNAFAPKRNLMLRVKTYDMAGKDSLLTQVFTYIEPSSVKKILPVKEAIDKIGKDRGCFLNLELLDEDQNLLSENFYWFPDSTGAYSGLQSMSQAEISAEARWTDNGRIEVTLTNPAGGPVAFFNRISLVDAESEERVLPVFYSDNYVSAAPGESKIFILEYPKETANKPMVSISGWNVKKKLIPIR